MTQHIHYVTDLQQSLRAAGHYHGLCEGLWGAQSRQAAIDYLASVGFSVDPEIDDEALMVIVHEQLGGAS